MGKNVYFVSGLPRSGSTLLGGLLRQNPAFEAGMSTPVFALMSALLPKMSNATEFGPAFNEEQRANVLRGLFESYYQHSPATSVFDTNRGWTQKLHVLMRLFEDVKIICLVRPIPEILQSFENQFYRSPLLLSQIIGYEPDTSVYVRTDRLMMGGGTVGFALNALKEAFYGPNSDRLMIVSYNAIANQPQAVMRGIYEFVGEPLFKHDFGNVDYEATEFDTLLAAPGLHKVRKEVKPVQQTRTLPPDIVNRFSGGPFWETDGDFTRSNLAFAK
ncbi:MAG: sulfotransferase [Novosphingobium sp.]